MLVSYNWLQSFFKESLPEPRALGLLLNTRAFEVEGIESVGSDFSIDIDVQPNRAHDCMSHYGIAKEIGVLTGMRVDAVQFDGSRADQSAAHRVELAPDVACSRYVSKQLTGVRVGETPAIIKERLSTLKQRSINVLVDIANYVMLEVGQPLHVFDADKIVGSIMVRPAATGEQMKTLDGTDVTFAGGELVIADEEGVLALAGIKGGTRAEVTASTTNIILEAAHFDASAIRRTSAQVGISTDASKRFERAISPTFADTAMRRLTDLLLEHTATPQTVVYETVDVYPRPVGTYKTGTSLREINQLLGTSYSDEEVRAVLTRLGFSFEVVQPHEQVVAQATNLVGKAPYKYGASVLFDAPRAFDCSSLVSYLYKEAGVSIPRVTVDQYMWGRPITKEELVPGDIIFCDLGSSAAGEDKQFYHETTVDFMKGMQVGAKLDHNGIYIGNGEVVHASSKAGNTVAREVLESSVIFSHIVGYRRMATLGEPRYVISVPDERLDIRMPADIAEEIARVHGYEHITPAPINHPQTYVPNATYVYLNQIRQTLRALGFSEIMTSTFTMNGDIEAEKAMASDKAFLRTNLTDAVRKAVAHNEKLLDLLGLDRVRLFEIGAVFTNDGEHVHLALGVSGKKADAVVGEALAALTLSGTSTDGVAELALQVPETVAEDVALPTVGPLVYQPFSVFPFVVRDIALWVPSSTTPESLEETIRTHAGSLLVFLRLFDVFEKEGRTSYAFRLVFQSHERTLTDTEVNEVMNVLTRIFTEEQGFEVR